MKTICYWLLYKVWGWKKDIDQPHPKKYILCLAPHTSNWDFVVGRLYANAEGRRINYLMKKEWFFWPLGPIFKKHGGIPVNRGRNSSMTEQLASHAKTVDEFCLCITPEGTRKRNKNWKKGFYYIALRAKLPILIYALDYEHKTIKCTKTFIPTGDVEKDMAEIKSYYRGIKGKHPENFAI